MSAEGKTSVCEVNTKLANDAESLRITDAPAECEHLQKRWSKYQEQDSA